MGTCWRSSTVDLADRHCPAAIIHSLAGAPRDRRVFAVGTGVHAILEQVFSRPDEPAVKVAEGVQEALVGKGRSFEGGPREHLSPEQAQQAVDLSMLLLDRVEIRPPAGEVHAELLVTMDRAWSLVERDSPERRWRQALDLVAVYYNEEGLPVAHAFDYKGWGGEESWFRSTQGRAAPVSLAAFCPRAEILRLTVVNYQLRRKWDREFDLRYPEVEQELDGYRRGLEATMRGLDHLPGLLEKREADRGSGTARGDDEAREFVEWWEADEKYKAAVERVAAPGIGCGNTEGGCPFFRFCRPAIERFTSLLPPFRSSQEAAVAWALATQVRETASADLWTYFKAEGVPVEVPGGTVGPHAHEAREVLGAAPRLLAEEWTKRIANLDGREAADYAARLEAVLRAAKLGIKGVESLVRQLKMPPDARKDLLAECIGQAPSGRLTMEAKKS